MSDAATEEQAGQGRFSRRRFAVVAGSAGATAAVLAACGDDGDAEESTGTTEMSSTTDSSLAQFGKGDLGIVNYALTLEYIEAAFYADVERSGLFKGEQLELIRTFGRDESAHVKALEATAKQLGGTPAPRPETMFELEDAESVLDLAATVENLGAAAYLGQAPRIKSDDVLAAALSIHSVEARHAAALNTLIGKSFVPDGPFAKPADAKTVLAAVQPFIVG